MAQKKQKPCEHKIVYYVGQQPREPPLPPLELGTCIREECGSTISMGDLFMEDKYTWYVTLDVYREGKKIPRKLYIKNEDTFMSDRRLDI